MIDENRLIEKFEEIQSSCETLMERVWFDGVLAIIESQPKVGEWIPFNKKEPKEEGLYLCCFDDGFITTVEYENGDWNLWADSGEVVAWQSLPEPFKGETE